MSAGTARFIGRAVQGELTPNEARTDGGNCSKHSRFSAACGPRSAHVFREEVAMIAVFVTFEYEQGFDRKRILEIAEKARGAFVGMPGLRQKAFTIDGENRRARNVYLWDSEATARAFFTPELARRITGLYGVAPRVEFADVAAFVDNAAVPVA